MKRTDPSDTSSHASRINAFAASSSSHTGSFCGARMMDTNSVALRLGHRFAQID